MHLWSDYEGKTIADAYPLGQLIRPEGRSAFFATSNGTGTPAVIRLTESLNDEAEMMERWRQVTELQQEHLVTIRKYGKTKFESTPLAYALMEPSDGSLAEILKERPLTPSETKEVAVSLVDALKALHSHGLIHGMIEPANVMAVGEVVKLRSDCVRECQLDSEFLTPEECAQLKRNDVEMLATLLNRALTLERAPNPAIKLPTPFDRIVAKGTDGTWGLDEIDAALNPPAAKTVKPLVPPGIVPAANHVSTAAPTAAAASDAAPDAAPAQARLPLVPAAALATDAAAPATPSGPALHVRRVETDILPAKPSNSIWIAAAAVLIILALIGWRVLSGKSSSSAHPAAAPVVAAPAVTTPAAAIPAPRTVAPVAADAVSGPHAAVATSSTQAGWHVVAYTYNHEEQAFAKVQSIRQRHAGLSPEVFSPNGRAPYLVALGGAMGEREAELLRARARRDGLPRDTFVRHYGAR